jgi:DNA-binding transcriptional regulator LsrR (DeoR family)
MADAERLSLLHKIAHLYFEKGLKKFEIAHKINQSPTQVGLLLKEAQSRGIVEITVSLPKLFLMQESLKTRYQLQDAVVIPSESDYNILRLNLSVASAEYFESHVISGKKVAVGGGYLTFKMVDLLETKDRDIDVFPTALIGRGTVLHHIDPSIVATMLWAKSGHRLGKLHIFSITPPKSGADLAEIKDYYSKIIGERKGLRTICDGLGNVDFVFASIGAMNLEDHYLKAVRKKAPALLEELGLAPEELKRQGAIGDIVYSFVDDTGKSRPDWQIFPGIDMKTLRKIAADKSKKVVISVGSYKLPILRAILKGRLASVLITDAGAAQQLLTK